MKVETYEGIVENGCVHLSADAHLPEKSRVYVVVPEPEAQRVFHIRSPRLADPSQAPMFKLEVTPEDADV